MFIRVWRHLLLALISSVLLAMGACAGSDNPTSSSVFDAGVDATRDAPSSVLPGDDGASADGSGGFVMLGDEVAPVALDASTVNACAADACADAPTGFCGDGMIDPGEACDDGNSTPGDGCSGTCQVEAGYGCASPGQPCVKLWVCGNGKLDPGEACDDGNVASGDGCSSTCQVETGWQCPTPGSACVANAQCGDGILAGTEQCDDGNTTAGDGCSATCQVELGYACVPSAMPPPASVCHKTVCGDGTKEGGEQCDDGNLVPYDGCSATCTIEAHCDGKGGCTGVCGDGLVFPGEQCDDGNTASGDGCSSTCTIESGYTCNNVAQSPAATLDIPILYRDMLYYNTTSLPVPAPPDGGHPDFNRANGAATGLVQPTLGADHEPVWLSNGAGGLLTSAVNFCWWYHETGCGDGGANPYDKLVYLNAMGNPTTLTLTQAASGTYAYAATQFFPLDGLGWNAGTNPQIDIDCEPGAVNGPHNFSFTSELHYLFTYQASVAASTTPAVFGFTGDDDVWAFINNQLVVDLGGVHNPLSGSYTLNTANAAALGLTDGGWYSIDLFQAERHVCRSTYALTLSGFVHTISQCHTTCGDGIAAGTEKCDNGPNNVATATAYGPGICTAACTPAPSCGDAVIDTQHGEQCDDGTNLATYGVKNSMVCGPGCKWAPYCGDGTVQSPSEQCDNGMANAPVATAYGPGICTDACSTAPYCGDGIVETQFGEQCDGPPNCNSICQKTGAM
jgi:fibro-slime domain-containing protein